MKALGSDSSSSSSCAVSGKNFLVGDVACLGDDLSAETKPDPRLLDDFCGDEDFRGDEFSCREVSLALDAETARSSHSSKFLLGERTRSEIR